MAGNGPLATSAKAATTLLVCASNDSPPGRAKCRIRDQGCGERFGLLCFELAKEAIGPQPGVGLDQTGVIAYRQARAHDVRSLSSVEQRAEVQRSEVATGCNLSERLGLPLPHLVHPTSSRPWKRERAL